MRHRHDLRAILFGGGIAGTLDILYAIAFAGAHGTPPARVLQSVASGLLGTAAFDGGGGTAALGLALHFALSWLWATAFVLAARRAAVLVRRPLASGIAFGVIVFFAMRLVVLPLSAFPYPVRFEPLDTVLGLLAHTLLFGVPIAWAVRGASSRGGFPPAAR